MANQVVVAQYCKQSGSQAMAQNLNDKRRSSREIWVSSTHIKPHNLDSKTLESIRIALRERDQRENRQ